VFPRFITGYSGSDLKVVFDAQGVHIKKFPLAYGIFDNGDDYFYPLANAQITLGGGSTITTNLIETLSSQTSNTPDYTSTLTVSKDGTTLFTTNVRSILPGFSINDQVRHGGAGADITGFVVAGFPSTQMLENGGTILSGSTGNTLMNDYYGASGVSAGTSYNNIDVLGSIVGFFKLLGTAVGISSNALFPFWLWAIIAAPSIATLIMIYYEMCRGN
jgi:hypothetical protein